MCRVVYFFIIFFFLPIRSFSQSDIFYLDILDDKIKLTSPRQYHPHLHILLHNRGTGKVLGRLETAKKRIIEFIALKPGESHSIPIAHIVREKIYYHSLFPPFQEIEFIIGRSYYEIPEKN